VISGTDRAGAVAVKRLTAVEVDPDASHQREFHAGRLRTRLGFTGDRVEGPLIAVVADGVREPVIDEATFTLYQARKPPRSEYHLYPKTQIFRDWARAGDLLVVFREPGSDALRIVAVAKGSEPEKQLLDLLFEGRVPDLDEFRFVEGPVGASANAGTLSDALAPEPAIARSYPVTEHPLYETALVEGRYPKAKDMARAAGEIVARTRVEALDPDSLLTALLDAETALYFAIEKELAGAELRNLLDSSPDLTAVLDFSTRRSNARKSRRGLSLQNHFEVVLVREDVPYTAQCSTGSPPVADIMVPSCAAYRDPEFPADCLRMVSCKSTVRERWQETIPESPRIPTKYLLTLDGEMSDSKIKAMLAANVQPFLPEATIRDSYEDRPTRELLRNVSTLIAELEAAGRNDA
jgi:hypothetical protein